MKLQSTLEPVAVRWCPASCSTRSLEVFVLTIINGIKINKSDKLILAWQIVQLPSRIFSSVGAFFLQGHVTRLTRTLKYKKNLSILDTINNNKRKRERRKRKERAHNKVAFCSKTRTNQMWLRVTGFLSAACESNPPQHPEKNNRKNPSEIYIYLSVSSPRQSGRVRNHKSAKWKGDT